MLHLKTFINKIVIRNSSKFSSKLTKPSNVWDSHQKSSRIAFEKSFDSMVKQLTENEFNVESKELIKANQWLKNVVEYSMTSGKLNRGTLAILTYDLLAKPEDKTEQHMENVRALGWALELFQTYFLMIDDVMDQSITRRGKPCWYKLPAVGLMACNDATLLESGIYYLIRKNLKDKPSYVEIIELIQEVFRNTAYGQCMDMLSKPEGTQPDLSGYTFEKFSKITQYKTSYYTFVLPIRSAMYLSNNRWPNDHSMVEKILLKMGELFQIQDDYLDCFGDPAITGKIGTDIQDGKCCWNIVTALEVCSETQKQLLQLNYGKKDTDSVSTVKQIYNDINLDNRFRTCEQTILKDIEDMINAFECQSDIPKSIFDEPFKQINRRNK